MSENSIYAIKGRIGNHLAREDIPISPVGEILCNYFSLMLKDLYDFSNALDPTNNRNLDQLLEKQERIPLNIIKAANPKEEQNDFLKKLQYLGMQTLLDNALDRQVGTVSLLALYQNSIRIQVVSDYFEDLSHEDRITMVKNAVKAYDEQLHNSFIWSIVPYTYSEYNVILERFDNDPNLLEVDDDIV